ncbi:hypothetical protein M407DRAFT_29608 [Tulasnella calospora MUT 4182]|uniref:AMP-dependent synthetase/ligase domain-containing protein n=1 Tax=Tulasnella calospora MUT 4182 TaxID=1051891 RepID=A0A0C3KGX6_9AGAM|nr:hypothetical protein M407DRAFT_29608 [Tulasnella calospora MUT 4182]
MNFDVLCATLPFPRVLRRRGYEHGLSRSSIRRRRRWQAVLCNATPGPPTSPFVLTTEPAVTFAPEYTWKTYAEVDKRRRAVGSALESYFKSGKLQKGHDFKAVGMWAVSRPEWQITDLACQAYNKVGVAPYDTPGPNAADYFINHSEISLIFCTSNHIPALIDNAAACPELKLIVSFDPFDVDLKKKYVEAGSLFRRAVATKLANLHANGSTRHRLWDKIVFKKVQAVLGGQVRCITSGSVPINVAVMDFLKISFVGCEVVEGYGLTETCAFGTRTWSDDDATATGTVGGAAVFEEFKLVDVSELGYTSEDKPNPRRELCFKGDNVFSRYYKGRLKVPTAIQETPLTEGFTPSFTDEKLTAEAIDKDGWFHTGDNIIKLSQGEYVALEKLESFYSAYPVVGQIYLHGDSLRDHLIAVVVPDPASLAIIAEEQANHEFDHTAEPALAAAVKEPAVVKAVLDSMTNQVKKAGGLKGFEIVKAIHLTLDQFAVENGTLTPTLKIKRKDACAMHKEDIERLYVTPAKP